MTVVASDRFAGASLSPHWRVLNASMLASPGATIVDAGGGDRYLRLPLNVGGTNGSFAFNDDDFYHMGVWAKGDFDVIADVQTMNQTETGPPTNSNARLCGISVLSPVHPQATPRYITPYWTFYHRVTGIAAGGLAGGGVVSEWKHNRQNPGTPPPQALGTWNTFTHPDTVNGRAWIRVRRTGTTMESWDAPIQAGNAVPGLSTWTNAHSRTVAELPDLVLVGLVIYSSTGAANIVARVRAFLDYSNPPA